ncbi:MAG: tetratricopeptide repeat protein [Chloroflexi bacterium]|nr:tetratricopeptide repeat protein [Chloroflexota bacterium]
MASIFSWKPKDGFRLAQTVGKFLENPAKYTDEEFISAAELACLKHPSEWVIYYQLGDKYMDIGRLVDALAACQKCVELSPKEIRSTYALATAYNMLTRAGLTDEHQNALNALSSYYGEKAMRGPIDKEHYVKELEKAGLSVETVATQAMRWFERSLELRPNIQSREAITEHLQVLYKDFPKLRILSF